MVIWTSGAASRVRYSVAMSYSGPATANAKKCVSGVRQYLLCRSIRHINLLCPRSGELAFEDLLIRRFLERGQSTPRWFISPQEAPPFCTHSWLKNQTITRPGFELPSFRFQTQGLNHSVTKSNWRIFVSGFRQDLLCRSIRHRRTRGSHRPTRLQRRADLESRATRGGDRSGTRSAGA